MSALSVEVPITWLAIPSAPGYEASSDGRIRSVDRSVVSTRGVIRRFVGCELAGALNSDGYWRVCLAPTDTHRNRSTTVHSLIAEAFLGPRPRGADVRHLNGVKGDNRSGNLAYGSRSDNMMDAVRHGTNSNAAKVSCPQGHPYDDLNTYVKPDGGRSCRECGRVARRERKRALRAAARVANRASS